MDNITDFWTGDEMAQQVKGDDPSSISMFHLVAEIFCKLSSDLHTQTIAHTHADTHTKLNNFEVLDMSPFFMRLGDVF